MLVEGFVGDDPLLQLDTCEKEINGRIKSKSVIFFITLYFIINILSLYYYMIISSLDKSKIIVNDDKTFMDIYKMNIYGCYEYTNRRIG
jgi:hypothetical protein